MNTKEIGSCMRQLEKYKLNDDCARAHALFFFIMKDTSFFTFTMTSHANSVKLLYMLRHSMKYHAYFTFHKDKLEFMLKMKVILTHMKDLNAELNKVQNIKYLSLTVQNTKGTYLQEKHTVKW